MVPTEILLFILPIYFIEFIAAFTGSYYLRKTKAPFKNTKYLVILLWATLIVEIFASYVIVGYYSNYEIFTFIKDTPFKGNYWLYNIFNVVSFSFFSLYFISFLSDRKWKMLFLILILAGIVIPGVYMWFTPGFFLPASNFLIISRTLVLFFSIVVFYFELLRSNLLLDIKGFLPFYISVGVLVFNLCVPPLEILLPYFSISDGNELFVKLRINIMLYAIIFMYGTFSVGFLICSRKKKSSY